MKEAEATEMKRLESRIVYLENRDLLNCAFHQFVCDTFEKITGVANLYKK